MDKFETLTIDNGIDGMIEVGREDDGKAYLVVNDQHSFKCDDTFQAVNVAFAILRATGATQEDIAHLVSALPFDD